MKHRDSSLLIVAMLCLMAGVAIALAAEATLLTVIVALALLVCALAVDAELGANDSQELAHARECWPHHPDLV